MVDKFKNHLTIPPLLPLVLRQRGIICNHIDAARSLMGSVPVELYKIMDQIGNTSSGRPKPPDEVVRWFAQLSPEYQAELIGKITTVNVNLGYAYEHSFKLLLSICEINFDSTGSKGHNLFALFQSLPDEIKATMCDLYQNIVSTDLEFQECFTKRAIRNKPKNRNHKGLKLPETLEYYQNQKYFQHSRYKFTKMDINQPVRILLPIRFEELIRGIVHKIIDPKIDEYVCGNRN